LVIAQHPASSISDIFRTKTSSVIYKNNIEMNGFLNATEKVWRIG
jgi:hypothetical protein